MWPAADSKVVPYNWVYLPVERQVGWQTRCDQCWWKVERACTSDICPMCSRLIAEVIKSRTIPWSWFWQAWRANFDVKSKTALGERSACSSASWQASKSRHGHPRFKLGTRKLLVHFQALLWLWAYFELRWIDWSFQTSPQQAYTSLREEQLNHRTTA